jgi:hypothetical protein
VGRDKDRDLVAFLQLSNVHVVRQLQLQATRTRTATVNLKNPLHGQPFKRDSAVKPGHRGRSLCGRAVKHIDGVARQDACLR